MANFNLPFGVRISNNNVLDASRYVVGDIPARDFIITDGRAYEGLQTYVEDEKKLYILKTLSPPDWVLVGTDPSVFAGIDASLNQLYTWNVSQDGSIIDLRSWDLSQDSSIENLRNWNVSQDASILRIDTSLNDVVDALTLFPTIAYVDGSLNTKADRSYVDSSLNAKLNNTTDSFTGLLTINGSLFIVGDIIQNGSTYITHVENIEVSSNLITLRAGAVTPLPDGSLSGFKIIKPDGTNDLFIGTDNDGILRIGWVGDILEAVATREDTPTNGWYAYWDDSSSMFKTFDLKSYIDNSLNVKANNASLGVYATNASVGLAIAPFATNASVGLALQPYATNASVGLALGAYATNASVGLAGFAKKVDIDSSFNGVYQNFSYFIKSASAGAGLIWNGPSLEVSIGSGVSYLSSLLDVSITDASNYQFLQYDSVSAKWKNVSSQDASLYFVLKAGDIMTGLLELRAGLKLVGISEVSTAKVLYYNPDTSTVSFANAPVGGGGSGDVTQIYVDGSLSQRDASILWLQNNKLEADDLYPYATNASVGLAIAPFATNASVGLALGAYTTNASANTAFAQFIRSSSNGDFLFWNNITNELDVSLALNDLPDVNILNASDNDMLSYDAATSRWINKPAVDISTITDNAANYFQEKIPNYSPLSNESGTPGDWSYDSSYLYICVSTNIWRRATLNSY